MTTKQYSVLFSRLSIFVIYFWFGILKVIGLSPASNLVQALFNKTLAYIPLVKMIPAGTFVVIFGILEVIIGTLFLIPGKERLAKKLFIFHIITTALPLVFLAKLTWTYPFTPTLEGQYIIKNIALITCVLVILGSTPKEFDKEEINNKII